MIKTRYRTLALIVVALLIFATGCGAAQGPSTQGSTANAAKGTIVFADPQWDSVQFHNAVAQFIAEKGYGYKTDVTSGSTPITFQGLVKGDIDILMEAWTSNIQDIYDKAIKDGDLKELSLNFGDNAQGLYVPTYVIKGDPKRGIKPLAPDLKTVQDLPKYWQVFKDPEDPAKGRIYGAIPGWEVDTILSKKIKNYGLDKNYNYFSPGSETALTTSLAKAYEEGKPWVGYYWEPTWIVGKLDMTLLKDTPYSDALWKDGYKSEFPPVPVTIAVNKNLEKKAPEVEEFLKKYKTSSALTSEALAYMENNKVKAPEAAKWFLKEHEDLWTKWVPQDVADKVKAALK